MPFQDIIQAHFAPAEQTSFDALLTQLEALLQPKLHNLSEEENQKYGVVDEKNKLFVNKVWEYRYAQPALSSPDVDWMEFALDGADRPFLENGALRLQGLSKAMTETRRLHDYDNYQNSLLDYSYTKYKNETQPGSGYDTKAAELKQFFTGGGTPPPPPPAASITLITDQTILQAINLKIAGNALATGAEQFLIAFGDGNTTIGTLEDGILANYPHDYNIPGADASGIYTITITPITAGAFGFMGVLQFDNCKLKDEVTIPAEVRPAGIQMPNNHITNFNMQAASFANLTSFVPFNNDMTESNVNTDMIGLDNSGLLNGFANFGGGTNGVPSGAGITAKNNLIAKGWTVLTN